MNQMSRPGSDEKTGETRPASPGAKALGAMEVAARRARESGTSPVPDWRTSTAPEGDEQPTQLVEPPDLGERPERRQIGTVPPERWLAIAVGGAALLVVVAAIALAVSLSSGSSPVTAPPNTHTGGTTHAGGTTHTGGTTATGGTAPQSSAQPGAGSAPSSTTSTLPSLGTPGGAPAITSLTPSSGTSGQTVQVSGSNFLSSDGQIVATFGGQVAPTSCPTQTSCTVTVPTLAGQQPGSVPVTITTSGGTSNTFTFTYG